MSDVPTAYDFGFQRRSWRMLGPRLSLLASATGTLSTQAVRLVGSMLQALDTLERREDALQAAVGILAQEVGRTAGCWLRRWNAR